jgi:hypothetical protein
MVTTPDGAHRNGRRGQEQGPSEDELQPDSPGATEEGKHAPTSRCGYGKEIAKDGVVRSTSAVDTK